MSNETVIITDGSDPSVDNAANKSMCFCATTHEASGDQKVQNDHINRGKQRRVLQRHVKEHSK